MIEVTVSVLINKLSYRKTFRRQSRLFCLSLILSRVDPPSSSHSRQGSLAKIRVNEWIIRYQNTPLVPVETSRLLWASCCHSSKFSGSRCWAGTAQSWEAAAQCRHYSSSCNCIPPQSWPFLHLGIKNFLTNTFQIIQKLFLGKSTFLESSYKWMSQHWGTHLYEKFAELLNQLCEQSHHSQGSSDQILWCSMNTSCIPGDLQHMCKYT